MNWHPTTNLVQTDLLTREQREALKAWPHGYKFYTSGVWVSCFLDWSMNDAVYRGKPVPVVTSKWFNLYPDRAEGPYETEGAAYLCASAGTINIIRIDNCNGVSTALLEGFK
jgi:hypothetical protein